MKTVRIDTTPAAPPAEPEPLELARYLLAQMFLRRRGAICARWGDAAGTGLWFHCRDPRAMFDAVRVDEVIYRETLRARFRSCVFRLGSAASEREGDLCGVMQLLPLDPTVDPGPKRVYHVHASFAPEAGLWFRAAILTDARE